MQPLLVCEEVGNKEEEALIRGTFPFACSSKEVDICLVPNGVGQSLIPIGMPDRSVST